MWMMRLPASPFAFFPLLFNLNTWKQWVNYLIANRRVTDKPVAYLFGWSGWRWTQVTSKMRLWLPPMLDKLRASKHTKQIRPYSSYSHTFRTFKKNVLLKPTEIHQIWNTSSVHRSLLLLSTKSLFSTYTPVCVRARLTLNRTGFLFEE